MKNQNKCLQKYLRYIRTSVSRWSDARVSLGIPAAIYGNKVGAVHDTILRLASDWLRGKLFFGTLKSNLKFSTKWRTEVVEDVNFAELKAFFTAKHSSFRRTNDAGMREIYYGTRRDTLRSPWSSVEGFSKAET